MARFSGELLMQAQRVISLYPHKRSALIPLCHLAQSQDGWLMPDAMEHIAELLDTEPAEVLGTASFYDMLHTRPVGRYLVGVCTNIACLLQGAQELLEHAQDRLGLAPGMTDTEQLFSLEELECVAVCDKAPCVAVNWRYFGPLAPEDFDQLIDDLQKGKLDNEVPSHGVLSKVWRSRGLEVPLGEIASQRKASDKAREERLAAKSAAKAAAEAAAQAVALAAASPSKEVPSKEAPSKEAPFQAPTAGPDNMPPGPDEMIAPEHDDGAEIASDEDESGRL